MVPEYTQPILSIIVPVYNAEKYLSRTLAGVQAQTMPEWELIAVDDGSRDGSANIVREFATTDSRIRLVEQANSGVAAARNRGYAESNPDTAYTIFLDNDDLWAPDMLAKLCAKLKTDTTCAAAHGRAIFIDAQDKPRSFDSLDSYYKMVHEFLTVRSMVQNNEIVDLVPSETTTFNHFVVHNCIISPGCVLFRRSAFPGGAVFDVDTVPCDDWDLYLRLTRHSPFAYVPDAEFYYRVHVANASHNTKKMYRAYKYVLWKACHCNENTPQQHNALMSAIVTPHREKLRQRVDWMRHCVRKGKFISATRQAWQTLKIYNDIYHLPHRMKP